MFGKIAGACNPHPEKEAGSVSWTDWLNAASTPAPKQKCFNESGSLELTKMKMSTVMFKHQRR